MYRGQSERARIRDRHRQFQCIPRFSYTLAGQINSILPCSLPDRSYQGRWNSTRIPTVWAFVCVSGVEKLSFRPFHTVELMNTFKCIMKINAIGLDDAPWFMTLSHETLNVTQWYWNRWENPKVTTSTQWAEIWRPSALAISAALW